MPLPLDAAWLVPALLMAALASLMFRYRAYTPAEVAAALLAFDGSEAHHVIRDYRLPRTVIAPLVGASLAVSGVLVQTLTRNRIASPDILGLNASAALAVVAASVLLGVEAMVRLSLTAVTGALATALVVYGIATAGGGVTPARTVLVGITLTGLMISLVQVVLTTDETTLEEPMFWLSGSFEGRPLTLLGAAGWLLLLGLGAALAVARSLDALLADDATARGLGVPIALVRALTFGAVAALTGGAVAVAGPVAFIGLIVPHAARRLVGLRHRDQIVAAALVGALFATTADIAARFLIYPSEAPVGAVTALIGGLMLVAMLRRRAA